MQKLEMYKEIVERLPLLDKDRESLRIDRGFTDDVISKSSFKSCGAALVKDPFFQALPKEVLSSLLYDNILIPYFDPDLEIAHIRPHKFGIAEELMQIYIPYHLCDFSKLDTLVIAESEFKAIASCMLGVPAIGLPGIHVFAQKNFPRLQEVLEALKPNKIVVCFDTEVKDNPLFENFKPDWLKRYDTQTRAFQISRRLEMRNFDAKVTELPKDWMVNGKIDIDGALAAGKWPEEYQVCISKAVTPFKYKDSWKLTPGHRSYIERKIDRYFYFGPIIEMNDCFFWKKQGDEKLKKISNFVIKVSSTLFDEKSGAERLCQFISPYGNSAMIKLKPEVMTTKSQFIKFCYENGDYKFEGSDEQMHAIWSYCFMHQDGAMILKVRTLGYDETLKIWFFAHGAYQDETFFPINADGIVYINDIGYKIDTAIDTAFQLPCLSTQPPDFDLNIVVEKIGKKTGNEMAKIIIAWTIGHFFLPEIMNDVGIYPFFFMHGKTGNGKTTITNWISSFFGFEQEGHHFADSSVAGIIRTMSAFSMIPIWFEEYRNNDKQGADKNGFLRSAYDKGSVLKATKNDGEIKIYKAKSSLIISGEERPKDAATNSRFIPYLVTDKIASVEDYNWIEANKSSFSYFGHWILTNKKTLWPKIKAHIGSNNLSELTIKARTKIQMSIINAISKAFFAETTIEEEKFVTDFAMSLDKDRTAEQALYVFLEDVHNMAVNGLFKQKLWKHETRAFHNPELGKWEERSHVYLSISPIYSTWEHHYRTGRSDLPASRQALQNHLKSEPYFCGMRNVRIEKVTQRCFDLVCIDSMPPPVRSLCDYIIETDTGEAINFNNDANELGIPF